MAKEEETIRQLHEDIKRKNKEITLLRSKVNIHVAKKRHLKMELVRRTVIIIHTPALLFL